ncbi:hypothetical protein BDA99DRAFT_525381 [Phascolomyces articulosus]|uniref:NmrA-like domain-containing protein n=1 Tax=Phascolomyces articulosus TaxID=60185 RepID=A0AAD5JPA8_9FUNG|nr:hypothetical protein BDA99DRAFT_525381 [Phascolomyces articulosus]
MSIYVVGGTGTIGSLVVQELIQQGAKVTIYARNPQKVEKADNASVIQGDFDYLAPLEKSLVGHERLFLLVPDRPDLCKIKTDISKMAYAAGVQQIVDISSTKLPWRSYNLLHQHELAEEAIFAIPNRGKYVSIRPTSFMTNTLFTVHTIKNQDVVVDSADADEYQEWISPLDIAQVVARILTLDPIEKHQDTGYELIGDRATPSERAAILSKVLGRPITYKQLPVQDLYDILLKFSHDHGIAYFLSTFQRAGPVTRGLPVLLGRSPETFEIWATKNKQAFQ